MATLENFVQPLAQELGEDWSDLEVRDQFLNWYIAAFEEIASLHQEWPVFFARETVVTVTGTALYNLASNTGSVRIVVDDDNDAQIPLQHIGQLTRRALDLSLRGRPRSVIIESFTNGVMTIRFWPIPDSALTYTLFRVLLPQTLTLITPLPLPATFGPYFRAAVKQRFYESADDADWWQRQDRMRLRMLQALEREYLHPAGVEWVLQERDVRATNFQDPWLPGEFPRVF